MKYSIIIPAYNRAWCIKRAINSALCYLGNGGFDGEIIIVDDGSADETIRIAQEFIKAKKDIPVNIVHFIDLKINRGVCAAKNAGAKAANGDWVVFLDSDDELIADSYDAMNKSLEEYESKPVHFYGTVDESNRHIEKSDSIKTLDINRLVLNGTGGRETLPVIKGNVVKTYPYDEDICGYEGLTYFRLAKDYGSLILHSLTVRYVHTTHDDRLSSKMGVKVRLRSLARGHKRALVEHWSAFNWAARIKMGLRYAKAIVLSLG